MEDHRGRELPGASAPCVGEGTHTTSPLSPHHVPSSDPAQILLATRPRKGRHREAARAGQGAHRRILLLGAAVKPPTLLKYRDKRVVLPWGFVRVFLLLWVFFLRIQAVSALRLCISFLASLLWLVTVQGRKVCAISCCLSLMLLRYCKNVRYPPVGCNHFTLMFHSC